MGIKDFGTRLYETFILRRPPGGPYGRGRPRLDSPPHAPGEYIIVDRQSGKKQYIGYSTDLASRKRQHLAAGKLDPDKHAFAHKAASPTATLKDLREHERRKIKKHKPPLNRHPGSPGRPPKPK